jgi:hypothetical protein
MKSRLQEILATGIAPGFNTKQADPTAAVRSVPRAFKDLEQTMPADRIAKAAGHSIKEIKRVWNI